MKRLIPLLLIVTFAYGCSLSKGVNKMLRKTRTELDSTVNSATRTAVAGVTSQLEEDSTKIRGILGRITGQLKDTIEMTVVTAREELLGEKMDSLLDVKIKTVGTSVRKETAALTGQLKTDIDQIIESTINQITSPKSIAKLENLRDSLLGKDLGVLVDSLVQGAVKTAMAQLSESYESDLKPLISETLNEVKQDAGEVTEDVSASVKNILIIGGVIALILIIVAGYFYIKGRRNKKTVQVLTNAIDRIPVRSHYDELIGRIKTDISQKGLGKHLDQILKNQNLYQQTEWKDKNKRLLQLFVDSIQKSESHSSANDLIETIKSKAKTTGIHNDLKQVMAIEH